MPFWKGDRAGPAAASSGSPSASSCASCARCRRAAALDRLERATRSRSHARPRTCCSTSPIRCRRRRRVPDDRTIVIERVARRARRLARLRACRRAAAASTPLGDGGRRPDSARRCGHRRRDAVGRRRVRGAVSGLGRAARPAAVRCRPRRGRALVVRQLGATALFAAHVPRKRRPRAAAAEAAPRQRTPLWQQRKRAADLLAVASRYGSFPVLLETYRECLRDFFDMPALVDTLTRISRRADPRRDRRLASTPSPFAASLLFSYVASFLYDGDAPLAERRAQALSVDQAQLRELIGDAELRELLDADVLEALERQLQRLDDDRRARSADGLHDLLLRVGDLSRSELAVRTDPLIESLGIAELLSSRRAVEVSVTGERRVIAVEDAARYRDALGCPLPLGLPQALLEPVRRSAGRSGAALRAHARAVHDRDMRGAIRSGRRCRRRRAGAAPRRRPRRSRASSVPAERNASGAVATCWPCCGSDRWRGFGDRSSRSTRPRSGDSPRHGRASCGVAPDSTRCSTPSNSSRARRCRPRARTRDSAGARRRVRALRPRSAARGR